MSKRGLDNVLPLRPSFVGQDDPVRRAEREASRMSEAQRRRKVEQKQKQDTEKQKTHAFDDERQKARAARRAAFFAKRGRPVPAPRPSWAHEVDARGFNADRKALSKAASKDNQQARLRVRAGADREARKAVFKSMRKGEGQSLKPEVARAFTKERDQSPSNGFRRVAVAGSGQATAQSRSADAAHTTARQPVKPQRTPVTTPRRTSFARTLDR